jgi:hypothetical protein
MKAYLPLYADSEDKDRFDDALRFLALHLDALQNADSTIENLIQMLLRLYAASSVVRTSETSNEITTKVSFLESAFCSGGTNLYEETLWDAFNENANSITTCDMYLPRSGTSLTKALTELSKRKLLPFGRRLDISKKATIDYLQNIHLPLAISTALWCPALAFLDGYDTPAQMSNLKRLKEWTAVTRSTEFDIDDECDYPLEAMNSALTAHPLGRGGLIYGMEIPFVRGNWPILRHFLLQAYYADRYDFVVSAALRLSQFRGEKGRDAASLDEVEEALSWKRGEDGDLEVIYQTVTPPEGAADGPFTHVIGLKPKDGCRKAFENTGDAWLVVRNPNFAGTLKRRFLHFNQYDGQRKLDWDWRVADKVDKDAPFALPRSLFCDDPTALEEAVQTMKERGWAL